MVSNQKRFRSISESTTDDDMGDTDYAPNNQPRKPGRKPTRTPKCFSKNALMARENRLKKKVYMASLENQVSSLKDDNKKLTGIVENQSFMIEELKKEIKYFKSVIANSEGIGKLIRAINSSTGMCVTSSLDKQLVANKSTEKENKSPATTHMVPEGDQFGLKLERISKKHPWEENQNIYNNYPTPESTKSYYSNPDFDELNNEGLLLDLDIPFEMNNEELLGIINEKDLDSPIIPIDDHTYHNPMKYEHSSETNEVEDVGVCLHVSKNKVSLEFCPSCNDNVLLSQSSTIGVKG